MPDLPPADDETPYDDDKTSRAIDEIVAKEGDTVLAAEDEKKGASTVKVARGRGNLFAAWWHNPWARWLTILIVLGGIAGVIATPTTRYFMLNQAGVQAAASVKTVDDTTGLPLKGVRVTLGGRSVDTGADGVASFRGLALGPHSLKIEQPGFGVVDQKLVLGWGSNPLGVYKLKSVGVRFTIEARDYLTDKPLAGVQAISGESTAVSDKNGKVTITLTSLSEAADPVVLSKAGYRNEEITLDQDARKTTKALLVPAQKTVYVTKQSGKYDVYKSDIDGKNPQVLLAGTGSETSNISLVVSPDGAKVAVVSTRDNQRDSGGLLLSSLLIVNLSDGDAVSIAKAAQLQLIDWVGSRLIFEQVSSDASTPVNARYAVIGYNVTDNTRVQLAAAKRLNAVFSAQGKLYYAVASDPTDAAVKPAFYRINSDGSGKQVAIDAEIWSGQRVDFNTLNLQSAGEGWYAYDVRAGRATNIPGPTTYVNRLYTENLTGHKSLWVESRDGQGILQQYEASSGKESRVIAQGGLTYPVRWLAENIVVYRVVTGGEVADYAVSLLGGPASKITDVTNTYGYSSGQ
jgi:hypothetical protein